MKRVTLGALALTLAVSVLAPSAAEPSGGHFVGGGHIGYSRPYGMRSSYQGHGYWRHRYGYRRLGNDPHRYGHRSGRWYYRGRSWSPYAGFGLRALW